MNAVILFSALAATLLASCTAPRSLSVYLAGAKTVKLKGENGRGVSADKTFSGKPLEALINRAAALQLKKLASVVQARENPVAAKYSCLLIVQGPAGSERHMWVMNGSLLGDFNDGLFEAKDGQDIVDLLSCECGAGAPPSATPSRPANGTSTTPSVRPP